MKYHVKIAVTIEAGQKIENDPQGPGPKIGRLMARFKPEATYFGTNERTMFMIVELATPADVAELMIAGSMISGAYPVFTQVVPGNEFEGVISKALPGAMKLING